MRNKKLEIERKLNITITMPQICHFCGEDVVKFGRESESLCFHSLDGNHNNWTPENKVPCHRKCHVSYHCKKDEKLSPVSVTIREEQKEWMKKNYFKLSKFVRKKLDEYILQQKEMELNSRGLCTGTPNNHKRG